MEKEFSPIECQKIMDQFLSYHDETCITMYQDIKFKHLLIVEVVTIASYEIRALNAMNLSLSMFGANNRVQVYMSKY